MRRLIRTVTGVVLVLGAPLVAVLDGVTSIADGLWLLALFVVGVATLGSAVPKRKERDDTAVDGP